MAEKKAPKQQKLPGFTEIEDEEIEGLAEAFAKVRDEWLARGVQMVEAKNDLLTAIAKNKRVAEAAKKHPKGKVKVGDALLTIHAKDPTTDVKVKLYGSEGDGAEE